MPPTAHPRTRRPRAALLRSLARRAAAALVALGLSGAPAVLAATAAPAAHRCGCKSGRCHCPSCRHEGAAAGACLRSGCELPDSLRPASPGGDPFLAPEVRRPQRLTSTPVAPRHQLGPGATPPSPEPPPPRHA